MESEKLPFAEKQARYQEVRNRLTGFVVQGETEPSFSLVDRCQAIFDSGALTWIPPSACTKRDMEIQAAPKESQVLKIEAQTLRVDTESKDIGDADHGSEIKLQWCFQRRGVALEMCNLVSWDISQEWLATMYNTYATDPPPGYGKVTLQQLIRADKELWTLIARSVTSVKPDGIGNRPIDQVMKRLMTDPRVTMHMLALPNKAAASHVSVDPGDHKRQSSGAAAPSSQRPQAKKKSKASRPGKGQRTRPSPPDELKDCYQTTSDGRPICWAYNLKQGCSLNVSGQPPACAKGCHCCAFCRKVGHSFQNCKSAPHNRGGS